MMNRHRHRYEAPRSDITLRAVIWALGLSLSMWAVVIILLWWVL